MVSDWYTAKWPLGDDVPDGDLARHVHARRVGRGRARRILLRGAPQRVAVVAQLVLQPGMQREIDLAELERFIVSFDDSITFYRFLLTKLARQNTLFMIHTSCFSSVMLLLWLTANQVGHKGLLGWMDGDEIGNSAHGVNLKICNLFINS